MIRKLSLRLEPSWSYEPTSVFELTEDGTVLYFEIASSPSGEVPQKQTLSSRRPSKDDWIEFENTMDEIGIWSWNTSDFIRVSDGWAWQLALVGDNRHVSIKADFSIPKSGWENLLDALERLSGTRP